jgi:uncharacterized protein
MVDPPGGDERHEPSPAVGAPASHREPAPAPGPTTRPAWASPSGPVPVPASEPSGGSGPPSPSAPAPAGTTGPSPQAAVSPAFRPSGLRPLDPKQMQVWRVGYGITALVFVLLVLGADAVVRLGGNVDPPWPSGMPALVLAVLLGVLVWRMPRLAYERWRYELAEETLELHRGVIVQAHTAIPYFRVQHIDITRSPVERALGLSQLVVRTAAATTDATIPGIAATEAESLRDVILARTGRDDAV